MMAEDVMYYQTMMAEDVMYMVAEEEEEEIRDWRELPQHIVELIMNKLMTPPAGISDYVHCGAVCTSWRTAFIRHRHRHHPPPGTPSVTLPPFLIVPTPSSSSSTKKNKKEKKTVRHNYSNKKNKKKKKKKVRRTEKTKSLSFYNIIDKKIYSQFQVTIPKKRYFRGSSHGWLVAVDQNYNTCQIRLFNPFLSYSSSSSSSSSSSGVVYNANNNIRKGEILLPSLKHLEIVFEENIRYHDVNYGYPNRNSPSSYAYLRKAVLSADPLSNPIDYIVMAILGTPGRLAYCRPGDGSCHNKAAWTLVEFEYNKLLGFRDVVYYKGKFCALYYPGTVVVLDPTRNMMAVTTVTLEIDPLLPWCPRLRTADTMYLVESAGSLLQVHREVEVGDEDTVTGRTPYSTTRFKVFKLWDETKKMNYDIVKELNHQHHHEQQEQKEGEYGLELRWMFMKRIGGQTLFLGDNHSISIRASDYPGCQPNSIYFTDDYIDMYYSEPWDGPHDLGFFDLVDGTINNHYPTDHNIPIWPVPIWIQPTVLTNFDPMPNTVA